jgi:abortive infection bacteriophage resistance protein
MVYTKVATTIQQQIDQLRQRGLSITDDQQAAHFLANISYYRLEGYWWPMQSDRVNHIFKPNSRFVDVIALYNFDRELRLLIFDIIERIEVAFRTKMIYHLSHSMDPWWFGNSANFKNAVDHTNSLILIDRERPTI